MLNINKLKGRIVEKYGNQEAFAKALNVTEVTVSKKLNGKSAFTQNDILLWCDHLGIENDEIASYFFA